MHFHVYYRELPNGEWIYIKKVYAFSENNAICKAAKAQRRKPKKMEYKAEIHDEDIESIQTFGENNIPKIIWKKKENE